MNSTPIFKDVFEGLADLGQQIVNLFPRLVRASIVLILGIIAVKVSMILIDRFMSYIKISVGLKEILEVLIKIGLWTLLVVAVLQALGLSNVALALAGLLAAFSFGISQGLTQSVSDLVSGLQLANDHDFRIGDQVEVGDKDLRVKGYILEMDTKKSRIIDKDGNLHVIPNSVVDRNSWTLIERDEVAYERMHRDDIMKVIHHKLKKGLK